MGDVYSVVVVGPIGDRDLEHPRSVPVSKHVNNICEAAEICCRILQRDRPTLQLDIRSCNDVRVAGITKPVMRMMDQADFGIADISFNSTATQYEIATLHAMGVPVILLDYRELEGETRNPTFYLLDQKRYTIDDYTVEKIAEAIFPVIDHTIKEVDAGIPSTNPISAYYDDNSLTEASPAAGLAIGQFFNFVRHVIHESEGAIVLSEGAYTKLVAIEPQRVQDVGIVKARLEAVEGFKQRINLYAPFHPRKEVTVSAIGSTIIDFPTPMSAIPISPRYEAFSKFIKPLPFAEQQKRKAQFDRKLIKSYFNVLEYLSLKQPGTRPDLFTVMPVDEIIAAAARGEL